MTPFLMYIIKDLCCSASKWHLALTFPSLKTSSIRTHLNANIFHHKSAQNWPQKQFPHPVVYLMKPFWSRTTQFSCYGCGTPYTCSQYPLIFFKGDLIGRSVSWDRVKTEVPCHRGCGTINKCTSLSYCEYPFKWKSSE